MARRAHARAGGADYRVNVNTPAPSGRQFELVLGAQRATIAEVGASVREYAVGTRDVVLPFAPDRIAPAFSGAVLVPWPNRLRDGRYSYAGVEHQVAVFPGDRQQRGSDNRMTAVKAISHRRSPIVPNPEEARLLRGPGRPPPLLSSAGQNRPDTCDLT